MTQTTTTVSVEVDGETYEASWEGDDDEVTIRAPGKRTPIMATWIQGSPRRHARLEFEDRTVPPSAAAALIDEIRLRRRKSRSGSQWSAEERKAKTGRVLVGKYVQESVRDEVVELASKLGIKGGVAGVVEEALHDWMERARKRVRG